MSEQRPATQQRDDIDAALADFQARCDQSDPQQAAMLAEMVEHTRRLKQARGDWERPNSRRNWNKPTAPHKPPQAIESLREYKEHVAAEQQRKQQLQPQQQALLLEGRADDLHPPQD